MKHQIFKVINLEKVSPYTLRLEFDDGTKQTINFEPVLYGEMYGPLRDEKNFDQVKIDSEVHTIVWENGADFDPALLHDWDQHIDELSARAKKWDLIPH